MTIRLNINGETYDDSVPAFIEVGNGLLLNRISKNYVSKSGLEALATEKSYTLEDYEVGDASAEYLASNSGIPQYTSPLAVEADAGDGTITFSDGPTTELSHVEVNYELDGGGAESLSVDLPIGTTADEAAGLVAGLTYVGGTAEAVDNVVTITATDASIESLSASIVAGAGA